MSDTAQKIVTQCTLCNEHLRLDAKYIANRIRCPKCKGVFEVQAVKFGEDSDALASREALATTADITKPLQKESTNANGLVAAEMVPASVVEPQAYASDCHTSDAPIGNSRNGHAKTKRIGRYEIERELGRGAFGAVFAANDPVLQRRVAIKLQTRELDDTSFEKMLQEARASAKLRHPNIVAVFEVDSDQRRPFVVSELIDGKNLADLIGEGPMECRFAATLIRDVARGLAYAHSEGLVHRDVKPQNILIDSDDRPQLTDFGLAVDRNDEQQRESTAYSRSGTLAYMAPEQAGVGASSVGPAVDQYAIAATLFEMLCGQRPHAGGSLEIIQGLEQPEPPRVRSIRSNIPVDLDAICFKAMSHEPWKRYENCEALADDLDRYLNGELIKGRKISLLERATHYAKKHPRIAAGVIGGAIAASGLLLTTTTLVVRNIYLASKQTKTLIDQIAKTSTTIKETTGIGRIQDGSESADLPLWLAYSRKLNSAARADSIGDKELFGKLLNESQENFRDWEYRHLEARRKQGLIRSFSTDLQNVSRIIACSDNLSCVVQSASSAAVRHYSIRDGALLTEWNAEVGSALALSNHSSTAYFSIPKTIIVKTWNWQDKKEGAVINLPFAAKHLMISNDDRWLCAQFANRQFAMVNLDTRQVTHDPKIIPYGLPAFSQDSSCLVLDVGNEAGAARQIQYLSLVPKSVLIPSALPPSAANVIQVLGATSEEGKYHFYSAEWFEGKSSIRRDAIDIASLPQQPQMMRFRESSGDIVLLNNTYSSLGVSIVNPVKNTTTSHSLLADPAWSKADISLDGRLVFAVANQTVFVWDTHLLSPQVESEDLGMVRSMAMDGKSNQAVVVQFDKVSNIDVESGKVLWSRSNDQ